VRDHLDDIVYTRLWILFERILRSRQPVVYASVFCESCGFIFTAPRFSEEQFKAKYEAIEQLGSVRRRLRRNPPFKLDRRAASVGKRLEPHLLELRAARPEGRRLRVLDYGGAWGYVLEQFAGDCDCYVLDYQKWDLPPAVQYLGRDLSDLAAAEKFDVILLLHTLEHVIEPTTLVGALGEHLADGGILCVEVPLGCFREWRVLREPSTHINFFSEQSLQRCLELGGLDVIEVDTSYQWVTHGKTWCLNAVASLSGRRGGGTGRKPLTTRQQMGRKRYYLPYLLRPDALRKLLDRFATLARHPGGQHAVDRA